MIPKIIHYCWLSNDPFPAEIAGWIATWQQHLPDYELMLWNLERFPLGKSVWVKEAFEARKYAFAADYIRLHALYEYGGIYLDSDVEVRKPFKHLSIHCSPEEVEMIKAKAEKAGKPVGRYLIDLAKAD